MFHLISFISVQDSGLRLKFENHLSVRQIANSCDIARSTVQEYFDRIQKAGLTWPLTPELDDAALENLLFPPHDPFPQENRQMPAMEEIHRERKRKGVTLQLLWYEYKQQNPDGYQYSQFCELYRQWLQKIDVCLRQEHRAGEKLFVDYAGPNHPRSRFSYRRDPTSTALCRHPGRKQLHLCRSLLLSGFTFLDSFSCPRLRIFRGRHSNPGAR